MSITQFHTLTYEGQRFLGIVNQFSSLAHSLLIQFRIRHIRTDVVALHGLPVDLLNLCILGKVEHHRTRAPCAGNIKRTTHGPSHVVSMTNLIAPLGDRLRHTYEIDLLEEVSTQGACRHLTSNHHDGRRIHHGIGNTRQRVGNTRTTGNQYHAHLTAHASIALSSMGSTLFVAHQYMVETFLLASCIVKKRIVCRHNRASRVSEDGLHPLSLQSPHQRLCSCYSILQHNNLVISSISSKTCQTSL